MLCKEIMNIIERKYAKNYALSWDNVGLLAGRSEKEVEKIYVAVDATDEVIESAIAEGADMLVTHHPLLMSGITKITNESFIGKRLIHLIQNDISYYAMHTNYDVRGMAELASDKLALTDAEVLEITCESKDADGEVVVEGIGRIAACSEQRTLREWCDIVKNAFSLDTVKVFGDLEKTVKKVAVCPGSGKSVIRTALAKGADVLITGDIGHHDGIDAVAQNLMIIDAGHYGIEHIFVEDMTKYLKENVENVTVSAEKISHPFTMV